MNFFQNHVAMGRTIAILQDILESSLNGSRKSHYEETTDRKYECNMHSLWISSINRDMGYLSKGIIIYPSYYEQ